MILPEGEDLVALFDAAPVGARYWSSFAILALGSVCDFFDFFVVAFLVAVLGPRWHLTYGQSAIMLLSAGVGSIIGALVTGGLADRLGRRPVIAGSLFICAISGALIAVLPEGAWWAFALLRCGVGFGLAGASTVSLALIVEYTPTRYRTVLASFSVSFSTLGIFLASATAAALINALGWRGLAALAIAPGVIGVLVLAVVPESVRWMISKGRLEQATAAAARLLHRPVSAPPMHRHYVRPAVRTDGFGEVFAQGRSFWLAIIMGLFLGTPLIGVYLWGPTITSLVLHVSVKQAASYFVYVSACGLCGKFGFSVVSQWIGRRRCVEICGYAQAVLLGAAAFFFERIYHGVPVFVVLLSVGAFFFDGAFANIGPYTAEMFPVRLSARGVGIFQAANGLGKIVGPMSLALIAGTNNYVTPKATSAAVLPAFLFLAGCAVFAAVALSVAGIETHGRKLLLGLAGESEAP